MANDPAATVLRSYPLPPPERIEPLGNAGGLSGAALWRITVGPARFCLRRWPHGTDPGRLAAIHRVLDHAIREGITFVPRPLVAATGSTVVGQDNHLWDLVPWLPGDADACPSEGRLRSALQALARFHQAASTYPGDDEFRAVSTGQPPGLLRRAATIQNRLRESLRMLDTAAIPAKWESVRPRRSQLLALFRTTAPLCLTSIERSAAASVPLQICLRDVWSAHVLFSGDQVTGLIDFDALKVDSVATDIARLLGSYAVDNQEAWSQGVLAYQEVRPLSAAEREAISAYDTSAVLLTGIQWLEWILLEGKEFDPSIVFPRLDATIARLEHLSQRLRTTGSASDLS